MSQKRRRGTEKRSMEATLLVRLDAALAALLDTAAEEAACSRPALVREVLRARLQGKTVPTTTENNWTHIRIALAGTGTHVGRLTGALVQSAKAVRENSVSPSLHREIEATIVETRVALRHLRDLMRELPK